MCKMNFSEETSRENKSPCEDPFYDAANIQYIEEIISKIESGQARLIEHELLED